MLAFIGAGVLGLSILPRYLTVPAVALCLFAGYAVAGFTLLPAGDRRRRPWGAAAVGALVVGAVFLVVKLGSFGPLADELRFGREMHDDLRALLDTPEVRAGMRLRPDHVPRTTGSCPTRAGCSTRRAPPSAPAARAAATAGSPSSPSGARRCAATGSRTARARLTNVPDPGFAPVVRVRRLSAYAACPDPR